MRHSALRSRGYYGGGEQPSPASSGLSGAPALVAGALGSS